MLGSPARDSWEGSAAFALARRVTGRASPPRRHGRSREKATHSTAQRVLLIGRVRELALYRSEYLRGKGFTVSVPAGKAEIEEEIERGRFDVVVLSYTLPSESVLELAELVRQSCPWSPIIAITSHGKADRRVAPDEVVVADDGPEALLSALRRVVHHRVQ